MKNTISKFLKKRWGISVNTNYKNETQKISQRNHTTPGDFFSIPVILTAPLSATVTAQNTTGSFSIAITRFIIALIRISKTSKADTIPL